MHLHFQGSRILGQVFPDKPGFAAAESQDPGRGALSHPSSWSDLGRGTWEEPHALGEGSCLCPDQLPRKGEQGKTAGCFVAVRSTQAFCPCLLLCP